MCNKKYRPLYNLTRTINIYTGKNLIHCPQNIIELLRPIIVNRHYDKILIDKCKSIMKLNNIRNKNVNIILCFNIINNPILCLSNDERVKILCIFNRILSYWNLLKVKYGRKNLIVYSWLLVKMLELIGRTGYSYICQVKRRNKLYNIIWEDIIKNVKL